MILLTFVENSNASHGTTGFDTQHLPIIFTSLIRFRIFLDCFFSTPIKIKIFCRFLVGALKIKNLTFADTSLSLLLLISPRSKRIFQFFPNYFPRHIILKHSTAVYAKHRKLLANSNRSLVQNFCDAGKLWQPLLRTKFFDSRKF